MVHSTGKRARTRDLFSRPFRRHGMASFVRYTTSYRSGDYVDIITDGSVHKGMPHKYYHGKTGRVFNVTQTSIGIIVNKIHNGRVIPKRIHVRIEHCRKSRSRLAFVERVRSNDAKKVAAKKEGKVISCKRIPKQPTEAHVIKATEVQVINPLKFRELY